MSGKLYVVATPIGNLEDITLRALRILGEVDIVYCEDTREGKKLLSHFDIHKPLDSFHARSSLSKIEKIVEDLKMGKNLAVISDAGTPAVSDPGFVLISEVRRSLPEAEIYAVPGPSALTAAISIAGMATNTFVFYGFLPHKKGRETILKEIMANNKASVFYESSHRILKTLQSLAVLLEPTRRIAIARELTKIYEELKRGSAKDLLDYYTNNQDKVRGEFVVIVSGAD
ncbi:MAG: 16S rRNA (cytidine(1402)-2'-O)-methyltransferase [Candidatus Taylorbacteria bacterium RIFCSPLOWO2_02_FULL_43_11]|uniref:Ribosomal RNA small subunit methyltransferase I n=1 Tax=Candidatus Taylorbacteria bacterium RIFCSPHIGHO2_02_FULL_43_32b TaxID=1802306 RepID=A0A1G2MK59_9BACT|nr:MAG: 16S rRNA (cytidine(1402)-2'-O)-methyltransferase [Candidatus Taylorbacteria bacterium RIFCSPHIGHO2_01_FULL_43_47]OHA23372.1 MAG: 16S rRNA (cytidine(1402)-2'-O)-methyltransferase [Candidatus Taylorbacteria bacterium RIFCSPHIGHO2_02_FULL_43_32b]OHA30352.1 MAG: 16S rRNA (cytidine(1402)-2'-O)-methyltransferase [Candidatus Taylorbacteria bacterium RIFCSPLOWO2_01_FULL_43_44]OHA36261.1 MAG: 16S rRNA (cytidine(1402)-2'-O)-methyltransferase [Candidatus Taylorbacteria bacterium RIFCSPLOWO2_02_FULL